METKAPAALVAGVTELACALGLVVTALATTAQRKQIKAIFALMVRKAAIEHGPQAAQFLRLTLKNVMDGPSDLPMVQGVLAAEIDRLDRLKGSGAVAADPGVSREVVQGLARAMQKSAAAKKAASSRRKPG